jgi:hypothetical protein
MQRLSRQDANVLEGFWIVSHNTILRDFIVEEGRKRRLPPHTQQYWNEGWVRAIEQSVMYERRECLITRVERRFRYERFDHRRQVEAVARSLSVLDDATAMRAVKTAVDLSELAAIAAEKGPSPEPGSDPRSVER